jgi:hypothetical protein
MKRAGRFMWSAVGLGLMLFPSCSRQPVLLSQKANTQSLPFNDSSHGDGLSPTEPFAAASIPAGTAIVIRLQSSLSSAVSHAGDQFEAVLDEPIVVQGQTLAPSGTAVTGRVLEARASNRRAPGYLRLTLSSLVLNGKAANVHTSSVFVKGDLRTDAGMSSSSELPREPTARGKDVEFSTGRRLTFRPIQPLPIQG